MVKRISELQAVAPRRYKTNMRKLDETLNGGFVAGSVTLLAGIPGAGKSTLLLQIADCVNQKTLYVTGEETCSSIKNRAVRLGVDSDLVYCNETNLLEDILNDVRVVEPKILIVDSLQTIYTTTSKRTMGTPTQTKLVLTNLIALARKTNLAIIIVGHSTKNGKIAGVSTLQHAVDTVLFLDTDGSVRKLSITKSRFGDSTTEWAAQMTEEGLQETFSSQGIVYYLTLILVFPLCLLYQAINKLIERKQ